LVYLLECELEQVTEEETEAEADAVAATEDGEDDGAALSAFNGNTAQADDIDWGTGGDEAEQEGAKQQGGEEEGDAEQAEEEQVEEVEEEEAPRPYVGYNSDFPFSTPPPAPSYEPPPPKPNAALVDLQYETLLELVSTR